MNHDTYTSRVTQDKSSTYSELKNVTFSEGAKFETNLKSGVHYREAHQLTLSLIHI